jgi:capsular polysaccharide transport system ATP-binding protein
MILFKKVHKTYHRGSVFSTVFEDAEIEIPVDQRIAVLGQRGSGKTTFLHLVAGLERPTKGRIERFASVSLPIGYSRAFKPLLSCKDNISFLARCYGANVSDVIDFVREVSEVSDTDFELPMRAIRPEPRQKVVCTLGYALPFDVYLIDEKPFGGSMDFREKCQAMLDERAKVAGIMFATSDPRVAKRYCESAILIADHKLVHYPDLEEGIWNMANMARDVG